MKNGVYSLYYNFKSKQFLITTPTHKKTIDDDFIILFSGINGKTPYDIAQGIEDFNCYKKEFEDDNIYELWYNPDQGFGYHILDPDDKLGFGPGWRKVGSGTYKEMVKALDIHMQIINKEPTFSIGKTKAFE